jgi:hypothetical protein
MAKKTRSTRFTKGKSGNPKGRPRGSRNRPRTLPIADAVAAVQLAHKGRSASHIARLLDAKPEAVKDALANGRKLLDSFAPEFARYWRIAAYRAAKRGDHRPAMAGMQSIKAVEPIAQTYDTSTGAGSKAVAAVKVEFVNFGFAGLPQPQLPQADAPVAIDVTARTTP